jgi:hypothetical protein
MEIHITFGIIIIMLLGYIIFLHLRLAKRNIFIETIAKKISGIEKSRSMDEMIELMHGIQNFSQFHSSSPDKLLEENTINFILENEKDTRIYMHYTKYEDDAKSILREGFKFANSFHKTALPVLKDKLDLIIKHNSRKYFGDYLIIICISNDIVNFYSMELEKEAIRNYSFENILTEIPPSKNDNSDSVYQLPFQFIKGYINHRTGEIVKNSAFDPWYNSPQFIKNIDLLRK